MRDPEILGITGGVVEADELIRLLIKLGIAERSQNALSAKPAIDRGFLREQIVEVEDYVFGKEEASGFRKLMETISPNSAHESSQELKLQTKRVKKVAPEEEIVKRFVKGYIDVADINSQQGNAGVK
jgi:hypothetical protein